MNYQPSGHDFVVENPEAKTFFVNREVFVSDDVFEREKRAIFDRCWVYVGHASEIKNPGDFKTRPVAGRPIIFCRDREGTVRALINCCRHRGALVCREREGNARQFYCMYHGWTYHPDGRLKSVPGEDAYRRGVRQEAKWAWCRCRGSKPTAISTSPISIREAIDLDSYLGKRQGLHRPRHRPVAVGKDGDHLRHAGIRHQGELEAAGREQRRRLSPDLHALDLAQLHAQFRRQRHAAEGRAAADARFWPRSRQRPSDHRQSELSRPAGGELDFGLWRGCQGRHRRASATSW